MKIIVADDEYFARVALISIIKDLMTENTEFIEAENGEELIGSVERETPDLIFLDIKMPKMGGLEAFSVLKQRFPGILWVIVTGYAEFSYARQALVLGAMEYLMKPVCEEEVKRILDKIYEEMDAEKDRQVRLFSSDIGLWISFRQPCERFNDSIFCGTILYQSNNKRLYQEERNVQWMYRLCVQAQVPNFWHGIVTLEDGSTALISAAALGDENGKYLEEKHSELIGKCLELRTEIKNSFQTGLCQDAAELADRLQKLAGKKVWMVLMGEGQSISWEQTKRLEEDHSGLMKFCGMVWSMSLNFQERDYSLFSRDAKAALQVLKQEDIRLSVSMRKNLFEFLQNMTGDIAEEVFGSFDEVRETKKWEEFMHSCEKLLLETRGNSTGKHMAEEIETYIREHFESDISVGQTAEQFGITPNYLSAVFKNETGVSFVQYLTEVRMVRAKELLACAEMTIGTIAQKVGYQNAAYFTRVFRDNTGVHPTEFRKQINQ